MKRLTHDQWMERVNRKNPNLQPTEEYCKAAVPITMTCDNCGNEITREANAHIRFGCPHCYNNGRRTTCSPDNETTEPL